MKRLAEILWVFSAHLLFHSVLPGLRGKSFGVRFRLAFERLGLTFLKLGQFLTNARLEMFEGEPQRELERILDDTSPLPVATIELLVERAIDGPIGNRFAEFEQRPAGSASIAQVHKARWHDGRWVAAKVMRPDVARQVPQDMRILQTSVNFLSLFFPQVRSLRSARIPEHFLKWIGEEIDFPHEAENILQAAEEARGKKVRVPEVVFVSPTLLVMTWMEDPSFKNWKPEMLREGYDPQSSLMTLMRAMFAPLFAEERPILFHGNPSPANLQVGKDGWVVLLDLGLMGRVTKSDLHLMNGIIFAVFQRDVKKVIELELQLCNYQFRSERRKRKFATDIAVYVEEAASKPFTFWLMGMARVLMRHGVPSPEIFSLAARFGIELDGLVQQHFPGSTTPELLGLEMSAGIGRRHILAYAEDLSRAAPYVLSALWYDPVGLAVDITKTVIPAFKVS